MVSHSDCEKQHNLRQFNILNVKQGTEAPSNNQQANVKVRAMFQLKLNVLKLLNVMLTPKKNIKFVFKAQSDIDVLIELFGTIILYLFLSRLIH